MRVVLSLRARVLCGTVLAAAGGIAATGALAAPAGAATPALASPEAPASVAVAPLGPSRVTEVRVTWTRPASAPEDADVRWSLCPVADPQPEERVDAACTSGLAGGATWAVVPTPVEGRFLLRVRFVAEGTVDGPAGSPTGPVVIDRTAPGPPIVASRADGVTWSAPAGQVAPVVRAHWRFCRNNGPGSQRCNAGSTTDANIPYLDDLVPLDLPTASCSGVSSALDVWLEDAAGNVDPTATNGVWTYATASCSAPYPPPPPAAAPVPTRMTVATRVRPLARGRHAVTLTATLRPQAAAGRVRLTATGRAFARARSAVVRGGRATTTIVAPRAVRRLSVRGAYAATTTHAASAARITVRLPRR
jgi:hypothetical protein